MRISREGKWPPNAPGEKCMYRIATTGLLIALFTLFSPTTFGGQIAVCEEIKKDPAYKGLYGLCNAYWNADEEDREDILRNFERKAGPDGPGMPGLEDNGFFDCPCWDDVSYQQVCSLGVPNSDLEGDSVYSDFFIVPGDEGVVQRIFSFNSSPGECWYFIQDNLNGVLQPPHYTKSNNSLNSETDGLCRAEVFEIATLNEDPICD